MTVIAAMSMALSIWPFPDRMSAFVWRNWTIVPKERIAAVAGATTGDVTRVAVEMGLPSDPRVAPEWSSLGIRTIIRRNWNMLPREQWQALLSGCAAGDSNSGEGDAILKWQFGGGEYPDMEPLAFDAADSAKNAAARRRIAEDLAAANVRMEDFGEAPFAFKARLDAVDGRKPAVPEANRRFSLRMNFAYHGEYTDGLLEKNAAVGVNAVWVAASFPSVVRDPAYPEFGADAGRRFAEWRDLVARARRYGIKVFLYFNDPVQQPAAFFEARPERAGIRGMPDRTGAMYSMCTSTPEVRRWLEDGMAQIFREVPGLGGFFTITASEARTNCASRRRERGRCARCAPRPAAEIFAETHSAMSRGMRRSAPDALAIAWDWGWTEAEAMQAIPLLPKGDGFMCMSEKGLDTVTGGVTNEVYEYAISRIGPSGRALREWRAAKAAGLRPVAKVQCEASWEMAAVHELPVAGLVRRHATRVAATEVEGLMLSWTVGAWPGVNMQTFCDWPVAPPAPDTSAADAAFAKYPYCGGTLYCGNQHMGPGNPLYPEPTGMPATMTGIPYDCLERWRGNLPVDAWIPGMEAAAAGLGGVAGLHMRSAAEQARFVIARDRGDRAGMRRSAQREIANAKEAMELLAADSRCAYEQWNGYFYTMQDLREKILGCIRIVRANPDSRPIGVFDSGIGGLTVLEKLLRHPGLAGERFTYLGDQANMPYGDYDAAGRSAYLRELAIKDALFLVGDGYYGGGGEAFPSGGKTPAKIVVIACNTATAYGLSAIDATFRCAGFRQRVIGVIDAGVRSALDAIAGDVASGDVCVGVLATPGTIASGAYERTMKAECARRGVKNSVRVFSQGCAGLADAIELGAADAGAIARSNLVSLVSAHVRSGAKAPLRAVILGCTHYPFLMGTLKGVRAELGGDFVFIDPAEGTAEECWQALRDEGLLGADPGPGGRVDAFVSVPSGDLPVECLSTDGTLARRFKYGRDAGKDEVTTKFVPLSAGSVDRAGLGRLLRLLPETARSVHAAE